MSEFKSEVLPSGRILNDYGQGRFSVSGKDKTISVGLKREDIARMYDIAYPANPIDAWQAWHDVSQKLLESELKQRTTNNCIACTIQERNEQVKQMPAHTCGIDGKRNDQAEELKNVYKSIVEQKADAYETETRRIAEILAKVPYNPEKWEGIEHFGHQLKEQIIDGKMEEARAMMLEMAKQYEFAYFSNYHGDEDSEDYALWNRNCIYEMQDRGLIPMT